MSRYDCPSCGETFNGKSAAIADMKPLTRKSPTGSMCIRENLW